MLRTARISASILTFASFLAPGAFAQGESGRLCEVKPRIKCLDKAVLKDSTIRVPDDAVAFQADGLQICDSSYNFTTSPDIVLIMDNTYSMGKDTVIDGLPRWCRKLGSDKNDPQCLSGDPERMRGPALQTFIDSAVAKGGANMNVGVVLFNFQAYPQSEKLVPLNAATKESVKATIVMKEEDATNYTAAFEAARQLLATSKKPKSEQFIIFVSDGRPTYPLALQGGIYLYKAFLKDLPVVHSIFLGGNEEYYRDMQEISQVTGGLFFSITDVKLLASILTEDISKSLFRRAVPTSSTVFNNTTKRPAFDIPLERHVSSPDSSAWTLRMPGPLYLAPGSNEIVVRTEYGFGGITQDLKFTVERGGSGPGSALDEACRARARVLLYRSDDQPPLSASGLPFLLSDSLLRFKVVTAAPGLDTVVAEITTQSSVSSQRDLEAAPAGAHVDSTWTGVLPFDHLKPVKSQGDGKAQVDHGEYVLATWRNPFIPEDSAQARVRLKYGPEFNRAAYFDRDGDGAIETVEVLYLEDLPVTPESLRFTIVDARGERSVRTAAAGEIRFAEAGGSTDRKRLIVTLAKPFPQGATSVANPDTSGRTFAQSNIPMNSGTFKVDDSVPPVIFSARALPPAEGSSRPRVAVTYSEAVKLADPSIEPLSFKRDTLVFTSKDFTIVSVDRVNDREFIFQLEPGKAYSPVGGDSIAINDNGETADLSNRVPVRKTFTQMDGTAPRQSLSDFYVTFAGGSASDAHVGAEISSPGAVFIPVDASGAPLPGTGNGRCERCQVLDGPFFAGSVLVIETKQPVAYEFSIYTNMGVFVARGSGRLEESDLKLLQKIGDQSDPAKVIYRARVVWTGLDTQGQMAGTGVYVVKAMFKFEKSIKTGAKPSSTTRINRFGFVRSCCRTTDPQW